MAGNRVREPAQDQRRAIQLRIDPDLHDAITDWAGEQKRSTNGQIEYLLQHAVIEHNAGRMP